MAEEKKHQLTAEGYQKLEDEKNNLIVNRRKEIAEKISEARAQGDLSENAEYDAAKEEQKHIEARIEEIDKILKNAEVIDAESIDKTSVHFGCTVHFQNTKTKEEFTYKLLGSTESNILNGTISTESPIGSKLMGLKKGQSVEIDTPNGKAKFKVLDFTE